MQRKLHANFALGICTIALLCASSQALPLLDQPNDVLAPREAAPYANQYDGPARNEHEPNARRSQSSYGDIETAKRSSDAEGSIPLYNLAHRRRDELSTNPSTNGLELPALNTVLQPSSEPDSQLPTTGTPPLAQQAPNPPPASSPTPIPGKSALTPKSHPLADPPARIPVRDSSIRAAKAPADEFLQAGSRAGSPRGRRLPAVPFAIPVRTSAQAPPAHPAFGSVSHVHDLYSVPARNAHKPNEHHGDARKPVAAPQLQQQSMEGARGAKSFSLFGSFGAQSVFAGHQRPLETHTHVDAFHEGEKIGMLAALRAWAARTHAKHIIPLFLGTGRRPHSPYSTKPHHPTQDLRRPTAFHRPNTYVPHPTHSHAGTIHMSSPSLTHSHPLPLTFSLSPHTCAPLAHECTCLTKDLASRLLATHPRGVPASTPCLSETVAVNMHGAAYRATMDVELSGSLSGEDFRDMLGLLVSTKMELVKANGSAKAEAKKGFGTAKVMGEWKGVRVNAVWTYYRLEKGVPVKC